MGARPREKPKRLAEKLVHIRTALGLSQNELVRLFAGRETLTQKRISGYESGRDEPSLITLLRYARAANVPLEYIVDDDLDLPARLPAKAKRKP